MNFIKALEVNLQILNFQLVRTMLQPQCHLIQNMVVLGENFYNNSDTLILKAGKRHAIFCFNYLCRICVNFSKKNSAGIELY